MKKDGKKQLLEQKTESQRFIGMIVYWVLALVCVLFSFMSVSMNLSIDMLMCCIIVPVLLIFPTFSKKISVRIQSFGSIIFLLYFVSSYCIQTEGIDVVSGMFLGVACLAATYQDILLSALLTTYVSVFYVGYMYVQYPQTHTWQGLISLPLEFWLQVMLLYLGMFMLMLLIRWSKVQERVARQKTEDIQKLLQMVEEKKDEAEAAAKAKADFLANMSHEIRTPMNAICGVSELLNKADLSAQNAEYVNMIQMSSANLLRLVNDILDFSKIDAGRMDLLSEEYSLVDCIFEVQNFINSRLTNTGISFVVEINPNIPVRLCGDEMRLRQILLNILGNAVKFTKSGYVRLKVDWRRNYKNIINLYFTVEDTGIGIKNEDLPKLFNEFVQLDTKKNRSIQGTGLGLTISMQLARLMGGGISVESTYGKGSTFHIVVTQKMVEEASYQLPQAEDTKFYILEPNAYYKESLVAMLKELNFDVVILERASELQSWKPEKNRHSIVMFDYLRGTSVAKTLTKMPGVMPVAMTGIDDIVTEEEPGVTYIHKPITLFTLRPLLEGRKTWSVEGGRVLRGNDFYAPQARVLVVDDNNVNLRVAEGFLKQYMISPILAGSGKEAIEHIEKEPPFDLIFMDHMMPGQDGVEVTRQIRSMKREDAKNVPIIALTANVVKGVEEMFLENGMNGYLPKPIDSKRLNQLLEQWLPKEKQTTEISEEMRIREEAIEEKRPRAQIVIPDVDADKAMEEMGYTQEEYVELLETVCEEGEKKVPLLQSCLANGEWQRYMIETHALKSVCASIGATKLSVLAKAHEFAVKEGNVAFAQKDGAYLVEEYQKLLRNITYYLENIAEGEEEKPALRELEKERLRSFLREVAVTIDEYDGEGAVMKLDDLLRRYEMDKDVRLQLLRIRERAADYEYEAAAGEILKLARRISTSK